MMPAMAFHRGKSRVDAIKKQKKMPGLKKLTT